MLLLPLAVADVALTLPVVYLLRWLWPPAPIVVAALWWLPALLLFFRPVQRFLVTRLYGWRSPTRDEEERLRGPWQRALRSGGVSENAYTLLVADSGDINAYAAGGSTLAVSSLAVRSLHPDHLEAILVHEMGHLTGLHAFPRWLFSQLMLPVRVVWGILRAFVYLLALRPVAGPPPALALGAAALALALWARMAGLRLEVAGTRLWTVPVLLLLGVGLARLTLNRAEYEADRVVVRAGLGPQLLEVLEWFLISDHYAPARRRRLGIPPVLVCRIRRVRRLMGKGPSPAVAYFKRRKTEKGLSERRWPWANLLPAQSDLIIRLNDASARGTLTQVDEVRIAAALQWSARSPGGMKKAVQTVRDQGAEAFLHRSGQRDLPLRQCEHDLEAGHVTLGVATEEPRNPASFRGQPVSINSTMLQTSLLAVGPPGSGKTRSVATPIVEHLCLQALANRASVVVIDPKGDDFAVEGMFDVTIDLARTDGVWGFDLYSGAASAEQAADRIAAALLPPDISGDRAYFADASKNALYQVLGPYQAAHGKYPTIRHLIGMLRGDERLLQSTRDKLKAKGRLREFEQALDARTQQRQRRDDPAASLVERIGLLDRPSIVELLDNKPKRFSMSNINKPTRVRIALPEGIFPEAGRILARLAVAQFVQTTSAPTANTEIFKGLVIDEAGRYIDDYVARGVQRIRSKNAGLVLLTQSLGDFPEELRSTIFGSIGCKAVFAGTDPRDAEYYADYWGKHWQEEITLNTSTSQNNSSTRRYRVRTRGPNGESRARHPRTRTRTTGETHGSTVRQVERYLWSPSEIINDIPVGCALISLAYPDGVRIPPIVVNPRI